MATFLTMQQELADRLNLDQTVTANQTRLKRWLNLIQQDISSRKDWYFLEEREMIQTVVQKTTGTVTATLGSTTVTGSGTSFASTDVRSFIQFPDTTDWYEITTVASATSITITPAFGGTTASGKAFTVTKVYYDLTSDVSRILDARQFQTPIKLRNLGVRTVDTYDPDMQTVSAPLAYTLFRLDPDIASTALKQRQVAFEPTPDAIYNIEFRYLKLLSDLSADGDISQIPQQYHTVMVDGAEWLGRKFLNDSKEQVAKQQYEFGLQKMLENESSLDDYHPVLQAIDNRPQSRFMAFPSTFEQPK